MERVKIIEAKNLKKYYIRGRETVKALDGVDFTIHSGEIASIVGPSGSGKTTLMNLISCLDRATSGTLTIENVDVTSFDEDKLINIRREKIGFIFQQIYLIPTLTVRENVELPCLFAKKRIDKSKINSLLELVGLKAYQRLRANQLSGGDRQKIAIARSLVNDPKLIIADEPTGKLENKVKYEILSLFNNLRRDGFSIFIATHDLELAEKTERIIYLQDGKIVKKEKSTLHHQ